MTVNLKLSQLLEDLTTGNRNPEDYNSILDREPFNREVQWFLNHLEEDDYTLEQKDTLRLIVEIALYIYDASGVDTGLSDSDYDKLMELYQKISADLHFTPTNTENKVYHTYPVLRGTLQKVYSLGKSDISNKVNKHRSTLDEWVKQKEEYLYQKTGEHYDLYHEQIYVFPKWDGVSCIFNFDADGNLLQALTRGDVKLNLAKDISQHFKDVKGRATGVPYGEKTEIMVRDEDLVEYNEKYDKSYKQTRSIASAIINSKNSDERDHLLVRKMLRTIRSGEEIESLCPEVFNDPYISCTLSEIDKIIDFANDHQNGFRCDGCVIYFTNHKLQALLGRKDDRNWFEVAYKFTEEYTYSVIQDVEFRMGNLGRLTPVAIIKPVDLKGNTISAISLGSMARFRALQLSKGDKVKVLYDIIPYLDIDTHCEISGRNPFGEPRYCPECGSLLHRDGDVVTCQNKDCPWVQKGKILNYLIKRNILGISFMTVATLYDLGFLKDISDLYKLKDHRTTLCELDGFGEISVDSMIRKIEDSRKVKDSDLIGSIGIELCSQKTAEKILDSYDLDEILMFAEEDDWEYFETVEGIGEKKAKKICKGLKRNSKLLKELYKELQIYHESRDDVSFTVCFTKVRDPELERFIVSRHGWVSENLTKSTSLLIVPNLEIHSSKMDKAMKYGIPIVTINEAKKYIVENF